MKNNSSILYLIIPVVIFFFITLFIGRSVFFVDGDLYSRDFIYPSGGKNLPTDLWNEYDSAPLLQVNKIPLNYFLNTISSILNINIGKILFFTSLLLIPLSFFIVARLIFLRYFKENNFNITAISFLGAFLYLCNPWVIDRITNHVNMVLSMAILPFIIYTIFVFFEDNRKNRYMESFKLSLYLTIYSTISSHNIFYIFPILFFLMLSYFFIEKDYKKIISFFSLSFILYFLFNSYWIVPVIAKLLSSSGISPSYDYSIDSIKKLGDNNSILSILQLNSGGAWDSVIFYAKNILIIIIQKISPLLVLMVVFIGAFYRKNKYFLVLLTTLILLLLMSFGSHGPIPIYEILFKTPIVKDYMWLYRDPSRIVQYVVFLYAILFCIGSYLIIKNYSKYLLILLFLIIIFTPSFYTLMIKGGGYMQSSAFPSVIENINKDIHEKKENYKVTWLPFFGYYFYEWNKTPSVLGNVYNVISSRPVYADTSSSGIKSGIIKTIYQDILLKNRFNNIGLIFNILNIKYIIVNNDLAKFQQKSGDAILSSLLNNNSLELLKKYNSKYFIFKNYFYQTKDMLFYSVPVFNIDDFNHIDEIKKIELGIENLKNKVKSSENVNILNSSFEKNILEYDVKMNNNQDNYFTIFDFKVDNIDLYDYLKIFITPDLKNTGSEIQIVLNTNFGKKIFNRYDLKKGEENKLHFNILNTLKKHRGVKLNSIEIHHFRTSYDNIKTYYKKGSNNFKITEVIFGHNGIANSKYNSYQIIDKFKYLNNNYNRINYEKINNTKYLISANNNSKLNLIFANGFDSSWVADVKGDNCNEKIAAEPLLGILNIFEIKCKGQIAIEISFLPQKWFYIGSLISSVTLFLCLTYLIIYYLQKSKIAKKYIRNHEKKKYL